LDHQPTSAAHSPLPPTSDGELSAMVNIVNSQCVVEHNVMLVHDDNVATRDACFSAVLADSENEGSHDACVGAVLINSDTGVTNDACISTVDKICIGQCDIGVEGSVADGCEVLQCDYVANDGSCFDSSVCSGEHADMLSNVLSELNLGANDKFNSTYFLVSKRSLYKLLKICPVPGCVCEVIFDKEMVSGSCLKVRTRCELGHIRTWSSSPELFDAKGDIFSEINVALSAAVLLSGNHFDKIVKLFHCLCIPIISDVTFRDLCAAHLYDVISHWWTAMQSVLLRDLKDKEVDLCGDGRSDSPGFSAQFCLYSFVSNNVVLHTELVDKRETKLKSTNMEKEACIRGLSFLSKHVSIARFCTDAHVQIKAMLKSDPRFCNIVHQFDVFHKSVKIHSKLLDCANQKGNSALLEFISSVRNHFWHCAQECKGDGDKMIDMWVSVLRHVIGEHVWQDGQCDHGALSADTKTLDTDSPAMEGLRDIVLDKRLLQDMPYFKYFMHTFSLESFHNELLVYVPKRVSYGYEGMKARCLLAVLDHNFHINRLPRKNKKGEVQYTRKWSKRSKHWVSVVKKEPKSFAFVPYLMQSMMQRRCKSKARYKTEAHGRVLPENHPHRLGKNLAEYPAPPSRELLLKHASRF
jgi:hypothetical protein